MKTTTLTVPEDHDLATSVHIEKMLHAIPGVHSVAVELSRGRITVQHEDVDPKQLQRAIITTGLPARLSHA